MNSCGNLKNGKQTESDKETAEELCRYFSEVFVKEEASKGDEGGRTCSANLSISVTDEAVYKALNKLKQTSLRVRTISILNFFTR